MKQVYLKCRSLFITLVMLCVSTTMFAEDETVNIDGVFYRLQNGWNYACYDTNGNLNAVKLNKARVDGRSRDDVWRINYDVPGAGGSKIWCTAHVAYKNGRIDLIRTDREGVVDSKGEIQSLSIDPLKYNRR